MRDIARIYAPRVCLGVDGAVFALCLAADRKPPHGEVAVVHAHLVRALSLEQQAGALCHTGVLLQKLGAVDLALSRPVQEDAVWVARRSAVSVVEVGALLAGVGGAVDGVPAVARAVVRNRPSGRHGELLHGRPRIAEIRGGVADLEVRGRIVVRPRAVTLAAGVLFGVDGSCQEYLCVVARTHAVCKIEVWISPSLAGASAREVVVVEQLVCRARNKLDCELKLH